MFKEAYQQHYQEYYKKEFVSKIQNLSHGKGNFVFKMFGHTFCWIGSNQYGDRFYLTFSTPPKQIKNPSLVSQLRDLTLECGYKTPSHIGTCGYQEKGENHRILNYLKSLNVPSIDTPTQCVFLFPYEYLYLLEPYLISLNNAKQIRPISPSIPKPL